MPQLDTTVIFLSVLGLYFAYVKYYIFSYTEELLYINKDDVIKKLDSYKIRIKYREISFLKKQIKKFGLQIRLNK